MLGKEAPCPDVGAARRAAQKTCKKPELMLGNVSVVEVFLASMGQVNVSSAGTIIGINYQAVKILMEAHGIRNTRFFWDKYRILEKEWLKKH